MDKIENGHITNQALSSGVSQDFDPRISRDEETDQEIEERLVSDIINTVYGYDQSSFYYGNKECEVTFLPRLVFNDQLFLPLEICHRLIASKLALEQDEKREEAKRNYVPSSVLTEAELYLRIYPRWMLNKKTGTLTAEREKVKESDDEPGGVEEVDLNRNDKAIPDGAYEHDSIGDDGRDDNGSDDIDIKETPTDERLRALRKEDASDNFVDEELGGVSEDEADNKRQYQGAVRRCELYKTVKDRKYNSKQVGLCWYYE